MKSVCISLIAALLLPLASIAAPADHIGNFNFRVEIEGISAGSFKSVNGLSIEIEVITYQDGDDPVTRKRPGRVKYGDITLKRGYIGRNDTMDWMQDILAGTFMTRDITLTLTDVVSGRDVGQWDIIHAWPAKWKLGELNNGTDLPQEEITIVHENLTYSDNTATPDPA